MSRSHTRRNSSTRYSSTLRRWNQASTPLAGIWVHFLAQIATFFKICEHIKCPSAQASPNFFLATRAGRLSIYDRGRTSQRGLCRNEISYRLEALSLTIDFFYRTSQWATTKIKCGWYRQWRAIIQMPKTPSTNLSTGNPSLSSLNSPPLSSQSSLGWSMIWMPLQKRLLHVLRYGYLWLHLAIFGWVIISQ